MKETIAAVRAYREKMLADPYRPAYHFAIADDDGRPGDPNGAFFADGRYHLMYLYRRRSTNAFHWGHISSTDLLHWRHHPDAIGGLEGDEGCFSGGAFVDDDGKAYLSFWKFPSKNGGDKGGIALAVAEPPYEEWTRLQPIAIEGLDGKEWGSMDYTAEDGTVHHLGCADPSNIWKHDGFYYMQTGNLITLNLYGREADSPAEYRGDHVELFRSRDLRSWEFVHRFYERRTDNSWTDETEDDMCPSFLPLPAQRGGGKMSDKFLQLFIAHNKGAQYYIGDYRDEHFYPEVHGRMSWQDNTYFAPEALIDGRGRQIMWAWLLDNLDGDFERFGWSGVYGLPRELWRGEDGTLRMSPAEEVTRLFYNAQSFGDMEISGAAPLAVKNGDLCHLSFTADTGSARRVGAYVRATSDLSELCQIYYDKTAGELVFDATKVGTEGRRIVERAPFRLAEGEELRLDIFIDRSVVEVYANDRQAICRRVYNSEPTAACGIGLAADARVRFRNVCAHEVSPTNPY